MLVFIAAEIEEVKFDLFWNPTAGIHVLFLLTSPAVVCRPWSDM